MYPRTSPIEMMNVAIDPSRETVLISHLQLEGMRRTIPAVTSGRKMHQVMVVMRNPTLSYRLKRNKTIRTEITNTPAKMKTEA
jgi:formamidopyrimidine-DNA glycosylase